MYQMLPAGEYPNTAVVVSTCRTRWRQFAYGLDRILYGLGIARDFPAPADP
jgi:hypothetical protein